MPHAVAILPQEALARVEQCAPTSAFILLNITTYCPLFDSSVNFHAHYYVAVHNYVAVLLTPSPRGLRLPATIYRRLAAQGVRIPYSSLHRFAQRQLGFGAAAVTVRVVEPPAGELAEVDFGLLGLWPDPTTGRRRRVYGFLVTIGYSRYAFLWPCLRQDLQTVLDGLEAAWRFFGGVPRRLVVDNLKAVVTRAERYAPTIRAHLSRGAGR